MLHPSTKKLIDKLAEMTRKKRVEWDEGENGQVIHDTEGYRVILTPEPHAVLLTDVLGKEIETCTPEEIAAETDDEGRPYALYVGSLYREASRHARGTERAIDAVLRGLESKEQTVVEVAPAVEIPVEESVEDITDESDPAEFGGYAEIDAADDYPADDSVEIDGESEMKDAVASLAEQVNNPEPREETSEFTSPTAASSWDVTEDNQPDVLAESEASPWDAPKADLADPVEEEELQLEADIESAGAPTDESYEPFHSDVPESSEPEPEATFENAPSTFEPLDSEPIQTAATEVEDTISSEMVEQSSPVSPVAETANTEIEVSPSPSNPTSTMLSGGFFGGGGISNLSRYKSAASTPPANPVNSEPPKTEATEAMEPAAPSEPSPFDPATYDALTQVEPTPEPEPAEPVAHTEPAPAPPKRFSLSGLASSTGFATPPPEPSQPIETPTEPSNFTPERADAESSPRKVIDGTVDLPDLPVAPAMDEEVEVELPRFEQPLSETTPSGAEEESWITKEEAAQSEKAAEPSTPKPQKKSPFNPWS